MIDNKLQGNIPSEIGNLLESELTLAANAFSGPIPIQISSCPKLLNLHLSKNRLDGGIPTQIGQLSTLEVLDLRQNKLSGEIPQGLGVLSHIETPNLSHNFLSSSIPSSFEQTSSLGSVDVSYNQMEGPLPSSKAFQNASFDDLRNNKGLCGNITGLQQCQPTVNVDQRKGKKVLVLTPPLVLGAVLITSITIGIFLFLRSRKEGVEADGNVQTRDLFTIWSFEGKVVYENIIETMEEFDSKYCTGVGGFGSVYKAELSDGLVVAVKTLHALHDGHDNPNGFMNEIQVLTQIRHCNIVRLYGFCSHARHSFFVYEFLEGGSLMRSLT